MDFNVWNHHLQIRLLLLPTKKVRNKTKIRPGENPEFNETFSMKVPPGEQLSFMGSLLMSGLGVVTDSVECKPCMQEIKSLVPSQVKPIDTCRFLVWRSALIG